MSAPSKSYMPVISVMLIVGIFSDSIDVYEVHNRGGWYDFGFLLGVTLIVSFVS